MERRKGVYPTSPTRPANIKHKGKAPCCNYKYIPPVPRQSRLTEERGLTYIAPKLGSNPPKLANINLPTT